MILFRKAQALSEYLDSQRKNGRTVGFVPTMGALHEGHISLLGQASAATDFTVVSIFVNPTQFNDKSDFTNYPITIDEDIRILLRAGADALFLPSTDEIYPFGTGNLPGYDLGAVETVLEGSFRPGHFQGVAQVMDRLLAIVGACELFMGQKDYQQCMVVARLLSLTGRDGKVKLVVCPTLREPTGLAMSSRNRRLSPTQREQATAIYRALNYIQSHVDDLPASELKQKVFVDLEKLGFRPDYVSIADATTLRELPDNDTSAAVALVAAFLGEVRLIDNLVLDHSPASAANI